MFAWRGMALLKVMVTPSVSVFPISLTCSPECVVKVSFLPLRWRSLWMRPWPRTTRSCRSWRMRGTPSWRRLATLYMMMCQSVIMRWGNVGACRFDILYVFVWVLFLPSPLKTVFFLHIKLYVIHKLFIQNKQKLKKVQSFVVFLGTGISLGLFVTTFSCCGFFCFNQTPFYKKKKCIFFSLHMHILLCYNTY